ncbi:aldo/keto reductase [Herbivorax sp. ANBcel31]|uniref:aldo/keto reductase n=1 Tax=Herbivorax sp. ANBcel31 TaxID=3069754 RepID=UPI0027B02920|nr:aldo/keto reductase [Herbivorax sp. ANBcel31]MDQ2087291.1 aldo/keto reductase [Herbivorax sp. ANBcel31]
MQYVNLGSTGINVSRLCFGGLIMGPLQVDLPFEYGSQVILKAIELGVNFIDTAELYGTYPHIREALKKTNKDIVIATKCYAYSKEAASASVEKARKEMDIDVIDIFLLHEQESRLTLKGHREALEYYLSMKEKGIIKAVGVSTHNVEVVEACCDMPEIDVIHPIVNKTGIGIGDGNIEQMLGAVEKAFDKGKGIYSMKPLGGGTLIKSYDEAMKFVLDLPFVHSVAVGMQSIDEVIMNTCVFKNKNIPEDVEHSLQKKERHLHIDWWCTGCGKCVERCRQGGLYLEKGKAKVNEQKCVLCSYCASVCPEFAIKVC